MCGPPIWCFPLSPQNSPQVQKLAAGAKQVLGGYFREFTHAQRVTDGWTDCEHNNWERGTVLDPFVGTGTTLDVTASLGRNSIGVDLTRWF